MLPEANTYEELVERFEWQIPETFNIGSAICDAWADCEQEREALIFIDEDRKAQSYSYGDLKRLSNQLASLFHSLELTQGDRVGVLLPQRPETAFAHIAALKSGAITIPLFTLFGDEALQYRLGNSGAKIVITDAAGAEKIERIRHELPDLETVLCTDGSRFGALDLATEMEGQSEHFAPLATKPDDPAIIIYTSGTTGQPKGALHAHRVLLGHLPGVEMSHDFLGQPGDRIWTPADWA
ncbi:MAG: AMP-binding protein, partial [Roseibium sp.]